MHHYRKYDICTVRYCSSNAYLKLGAEAHSNARHDISTAAYANKKKMVTTGAIVFTFLANSRIWTSIQVTATAMNGFPPFVVLTTGRKTMP